MRPQNWLIVAFTVALAAAGLMTFHTVRHALHMHRANEPLRPWMSIPFIARSRHVPPEVLYQAAGMPVDLKDHRRLRRIAREQGRPVEELIARLETAIAQARSHSPSRVNGGVP